MSERPDPQGPAYVTRLDELMTGQGVTGANLARVSGFSENAISLWRLGKRQLSPARARVLAPWLRCDWSDLLEPIGTPIRSDRPLDIRAQIARRFRHARTAWYASAIEGARPLGITPSQLAEIETGRAPIDEALLIRACEVFSVTADYIIRGRLDPRPEDIPEDVRRRIRAIQAREGQITRPLAA